MMKMVKLTDLENACMQVNMLDSTCIQSHIALYTVIQSAKH